ncbi:MAG: S16 family serine protease [Prosthecobacter sp.]
MPADRQADNQTRSSVPLKPVPVVSIPPPVSVPPPVINPPVTAAPVVTKEVFKSRINQVNGLLISQLASGGEVGQVTRLSLTALPSPGEWPSTIRFNQSVGESMGKALNEVIKFSQLRHGGWPESHLLEIGFEDKYIDKDGPSAAVACALLLEAAITGKKWDPAFAVTGDMNADGRVQPIGGVRAKIRGATKGSCKLVGVPVKNEKSVMDLLVLEGPAPLVGITVFGITNFDDALLLASTERPPALQSALTDFDNMRTVMMRDPRQIVPLLRTPHAAQRLQALLTAAPNCYSAKYLLLYLQGRGPRTLSIGGSIEAAQNSAQSVVSAIDHDVDANVSSLKGDELGNSLYKLRQVRPLLDARVWPYVDGLVAYGEVIRGALLNPVRSGARYTDLVSKAKKAAGTVKAAYDKLINDSQVREELGL